MKMGQRSCYMIFGVCLLASACGAADEATFRLTAGPTTGQTADGTAGDRYRVGRIVLPSENTPPENEPATLVDDEPGMQGAPFVSDEVFDFSPSTREAGTGTPDAGARVDDWEDEQAHSKKTEGRRYSSPDVIGIQPKDKTRGEPDEVVVNEPEEHKPLCDSECELETSRTTLWPPNGKMVGVDISGHDAAACVIVDVTDDETNLASDFRITGDLSLELRAKRAGSSKNGRTYTIELECEGSEGLLYPTLSVQVVHDQGKK